METTRGGLRFEGVRSGGVNMETFALKGDC